MSHPLGVIGVPTSAGAFAPGQEQAPQALDFTDVPLSEHWGRNEGLAYDQALRALDVLLASPRLAGLTITELNPDHTEPGAHSIERFAAAIAESLARSLLPGPPS